MGRRYSVLTAVVMIAGMFLAGSAAEASFPDGLTQKVTHEGETITLDLVRESVRGKNFEVLVQKADGSFEKREVSAPRTYVGMVKEDPGAFAAGILRSDGQFKGKVYFSRGQTWFTLGDKVVGNRGLREPNFKMPSMSSVVPGTAGSKSYIFDVAVDADWRYFNRVGSVEKCVEMIEFSFVNVRIIYLRDTLLMPAIGRVLIRAEKEQCPYQGTNGTKILPIVRKEWNEKYKDVERDLVACVTPAIGGGVAWVGVVGTGNGYSVNGVAGDNSFDVVWRHELGHNWAVHDHHANSCEGPTLNCGNAYGRFSGAEVQSVFKHRDNKLNLLEKAGVYDTINMPPYAALDVIEESEEGYKLIVDVIANDHDANGHAVSLEGCDGESVKGGKIEIVEGSSGSREVVYTAPEKGLAGMDHFFYTVKDETGKIARGVVFVKGLKEESETAKKDGGGKEEGA
ncbi:hypothetical protein STSP2_00299 [Anaerohalosphaera lusitana]|uniref:Peptidase M11 gametolysin domain-containing protein n=1 Tax=Anaerohalosphaera lusitana TaxID=1936003 RepID=A0A1U9NI17_9BACT|nr:M12 family metallo-peptidase [Anaerohalosphaera lusitana]AQT67156.1 hypothetical protein STSP2_00299 [Anaerohalosphaera lusitana]